MLIRIDIVSFPFCISWIFFVIKLYFYFPECVCSEILTRQPEFWGGAKKSLRWDMSSNFHIFRVPKLNFYICMMVGGWVKTSGWLREKEKLWPLASGISPLRLPGCHSQILLQGGFSLTSNNCLVRFSFWDSLTCFSWIPSNFRTKGL